MGRREDLWLQRGFRDWWLPTIAELESVRFLGENEFGHPIKGNIRLTGDGFWSSEPAGAGAARAFGFAYGVAASNVTGIFGNRALCVCRAEG
jgi:hypothetical protein